MIRPKKSLGQNFLTDRQVIDRILEAVSAEREDIILEIGPGRGALTEKLAARCGRLVAIEIDERLVERLRGELTSSNITLIRADALEVEWQQVIREALQSFRRSAGSDTITPRVRVVANLPYYISTPIIERLLDAHSLIFDMTLMLQREVVDRITSPPGSREYGYLSVFVQYYCEAEKLFDVRPSAFTPEPKVWSSVLRLAIRNSPPISVENEKRFFQLVGALFAQRRKTIYNNLRASASRLGIEGRIEEALTVSKIDARRRAETFTLSEFGDLYLALF